MESTAIKQKSFCQNNSVPYNVTSNLTTTTIVHSSSHVQTVGNYQLQHIPNYLTVGNYQLLHIPNGQPLQLPKYDNKILYSNLAVQQLRLNQTRVYQTPSSQNQMVQLLIGQSSIEQPAPDFYNKNIIQSQQTQQIKNNSNANLMILCPTVSHQTFVPQNIVQPNVIAAQSPPQNQQNIMTDLKKNYNGLRPCPPAIPIEPMNIDDVIYVNPKQYNRIIIRRQQRMKLVAQGRIPYTRPGYQYESRHRHAMRRERRMDGCFK